jgi:tetratricopeptide (TPR) repeat protein
VMEASGISDWAAAIEQLRETIPSDNLEALEELGTLEARLYDNLASEERFGTSENLRHERARILHSLTRLALAHRRQFLTDLLRSKAERTSTQVPLAPFVFTPVTSPAFQGRIRELKWLNERFAELGGTDKRTSTSRTILIKGEIGVGKSRLLNVFAQELLDENKAFVVIRAFHNELSADQALSQLAVDALYQYPESLIPPAMSEPLDRMVAAIVRGKGLASSDQDLSTETALWRLLGELAKLRPLVLVLENLHEVNPRLISFFEMSVHLLSSPLLVIGTTRPEPEGQVSRLDHLVANARVPLCPLKGLQRQEIQAIVEEFCHPSGLREEFYKRLLQCTNGNPYFVIEIVKYLKSSDVSVLELDVEGQWVCRPTMDEWPRWAPDNLVAFAEEQLRMLSADNPRAGSDLKTAALVGPRFLSRLLQRLTNYSDDEAMLFAESISTLRARNLIRVEQPREQLVLNDTSYRFQSQVLQEALYDWNPKLHLAVAQLLGDLYPERQDQERLRFLRARHYQAGRDEWAAIEFLRAAIHDAATKQQPFEGIWLHEHLLQYAPVLQQEETLRLNCGLGSLYSEVGRLEEAFSVYRRASDLAEKLNEHVTAIEMMVEMGWIRVKRERFKEAESLFKRAIRSSRKQHMPPHLLSFIHRLYSGLFLERLATRAASGWKRDVRRAAKYVRQADEYIRQCNLADPERKRDLTLVLNNMGRLYLEKEEFDKAARCFQDALDVVREGAADRNSLESYLLNNQGVTASALGKLDEAERHFKRSLEFTNREENVFLRTKSLLNLAEVYGKAKQYERLIPVAAEGLWYAELIDHRTYQFDGCCILGVGYFETGQLDFARSCFEKARVLDRREAFPAKMLSKLKKREEGKDD